MNSSFKRDEMKYLFDKGKYDVLLASLLEHLRYDSYCPSGEGYDVFNIYYDTPNQLVITKSIMKPKFKAKLRIRNYGEKDCHYLELKKKCRGVVYKRRIKLDKDELREFLESKKLPPKDDYVSKVISNEFQEFINLYPTIEPSVEILYHRMALVNKEGEPFLRVTLDNDIKSRYRNVEKEYRNVIRPDQYLMEVKICGALPLWLAHLLNSLQIYPTSFSKYGKDFRYRAKERQHV